MRRKYRFRKYYAVVYHDGGAKRVYVEDGLTLKQARAFTQYLYNNRRDYLCIDIVKRVWSWRKNRGLVDLEAL